MALRHSASSRLLTFVSASVASFALVLSSASASYAATPDPTPTPAETIVDDTAQVVDETAAPDNDGADPVIPAPSTEPRPDGASDTDGNADVATQRAEVAASASPVSFRFGDVETQVEATPGKAGVSTFTGVVVDAGTGNPVGGVSVWAASSGGDGIPADNAVTTAADGTFTVVVSEGRGWYGFEIGASFDPLYLGATGQIDGAAFGYAYDLGAVGVERGAVLSGSITVPDAGVDTVRVGVEIAAVGDGQSQFWTDSTVAAGATAAWKTVVRPGTYTVGFSTSGVLAPTWWKNASSLATATPVTVAAGGSVSGLDALMRIGASRLSGVVTSAAGAPLAKVQVQAIAAGGGGGVYAETDSRGRYVFTGIAAGSYTVGFSPAPGDGLRTYFGGNDYSSATPIVIAEGAARDDVNVVIQPGATVTGQLPEPTRAGVDSLMLTSSGPNSNSAWAAVAADGTFTFLDVAAGTYRLELRSGSASITAGDPVVVTGPGRVVLDLSGLATEMAELTITVAEGASISGTVTLLDAETRRSVATAWLSNGGALTMRVPAGNYIVQYQGANGSPVYYPGGNSPASAIVLELTAETPQAITLSASRGSISGTVTDAESDAAVAGVAVELYRADSLGGTPIARTQTAADGSYAFGALGVNNYAVRVVGGETLYVDRWFGGAGDQASATPIEIGADASFDAADFRVVRGGGIALTFADEAEFSGWESLWVSLWTPEGTITNHGIPISDIRRDGGATITGIAAGTYRLSASVGSTSLSSVDDIEVTVGEVTGPIALALPPAQIVGVVTASASGAPAYARVIARWTEETEWGTDHREIWSYSNSTTGRYRLSGIPTGASVTLEFSRGNSGDNLSTKWWQNAQSEAEATPILVTDTPFVADVALDAGIAVRGRIIDAQSGEPVAGISVNYGATTSATGMFTTYADRAGAFVLTTSGGSTHIASTTPVTVPAEGLDGVTLQLQRGYRIVGDVAAANNGAALSNINVGFHRADSTEAWPAPIGSSYTYLDGRYESPPLAPGRYVVRAENYQGLYVRQWFDGADAYSDARVIEIVDRDVETDLRMALGGTASGRVVDADGAPIAGATVGVATAPETGVARFFADAWNTLVGAADANPLLDITVQTDANGNFRLPALEPGEYTLYVYTPDRGTTWYDGKKTRADADVIRITAGQNIVLDSAVAVPDLAEGETPLTPTETLSSEFAIVSNPADVSVASGERAEFTAIASGLPVPAVQWQSRQNGGEWTDIAGANGPTYVISETTADADGTEVRAVFTQGDRELTSSTARLSVTRPATVPETPAAPRVDSVTTASASLAWDAPKDGGAPITGYVLRAYEKGAEVATRVISIGAVTTTTISGLAPGTSYEFTVAATNNVGSGVESPRTPIETVPLTAPTAPTAVAVTDVTATSLAVSWAAPNGNGGTPVTGYIVTASTAGAEDIVIVTDAATTATTLTGLESDTAYSMTVKARNVVGDSLAASIESRTAVEPPVITAPSAPTGLTVRSSTAASAEVQWNAPVADGGSAITGYAVTVTEAGVQVAASVSVTGTSATINGLAPSTTYTVTVAAINSAGTGASSNAAELTTLAPPVSQPGAPTALKATAVSATEVVVTWDAPDSDGGAAVSAYDVVVTTAGVVVNAPVVIVGTEAVVAGLSPDTEYVLTVTARNSAGAGPVASTSVRTLTVTVPVDPEPGTGGGNPGSGNPGSGNPGSLPSTGGAAAPAAPSAAALTDANRGALTVSEPTVIPGSTIRVSGLEAGKAYDIWFFSSPTYAGAVTADAAGSARVTVPAGLPAGPHRIVAVLAGTDTIAGWTTVTVAARLSATGGQLPIAGGLIAGILVLGGLSLVAGSRLRRPSGVAR